MIVDMRYKVVYRDVQVPDVMPGAMPVYGCGTRTERRQFRTLQMRDEIGNWHDVPEELIGEQ